VAYVYLAFAWGDSREPQKTCQLDLSEIWMNTFHINV
jgi:hypothetical protein